MKQKSKSKSALPIIFIMDMDLTMIGNSATFSSCIEVVKFVRACCKSKKIEGLPCPKPVAFSDLMTIDFVRPGLKDMFANISEMYPTAEFFVYSAGAKPYVHAVIAALEKLVNVSFNKPILTRDECILNETRNYTKSITVHYDAMIQSLLSKYPALGKKENQDDVLKSRIVFIDDVDYVWDLKEKWVKCPEYLYNPVLDITQYIDTSTRKHPLVAKQIETNEAFFKEPDVDSTDERNMAYHMYMAEWYRSQYVKNKLAFEDKFCEKFVECIKPFKKLAHPFSNANIAKVNAQQQKSQGDLEKA